MKNAVVLLAGGLAAMVIAQDLSECSRKCLDNMRGLASELGCDAQLEGDNLLKCLCSKEDYAYGVNDCTVESCSAEESLQAVGVAKADCLRVSISWQGADGTGHGSEAIPEASGTVIGTGGDGSVATDTSAITESKTNTAAGVPTVITSDGQAITTTAALETEASASIPVHPTETGTEAATHTTDDGEASETGDGIEPSASGAEGDNSAAVHAAAPVIGVLLAAAIAAVFP